MNRKMEGCVAVFSRLCFHFIFFVGIYTVRHRQYKVSIGNLIVTPLLMFPVLMVPVNSSSYWWKLAAGLCPETLTKSTFSLSTYLRKVLILFSHLRLISHVWALIFRLSIKFCFNLSFFHVCYMSSPSDPTYSRLEEAVRSASVRSKLQRVRGRGELPAILKLCFLHFS
jgi:hypothetical protein